jgi:hypothetical protein
MNRHFFWIAGIILLLALPTTGQNITRNAGLRGGQTAGITYRQYMDEESAYEGILSFRRNGLQVTGLKQHFQPQYVEFTDNLFVSWGYGGHIGFFYDDKYVFGRTNYYYRSPMFSPVVGVDGFAGIEYRVKQIPLVVGIDYKPFFELSAARFFSISFWDIGFSLKYAF